MKWIPLFKQSAYSAVWYLLLVVVLPVLSLALLGLIHLWQQQQLLMVTVIWLALTIVGYAAFAAWPAFRRRRQEAHSADNTAVSAASNEHQAIPNQLPQRLEERLDWSAQDHEIWRRSCADIEALLNQQPTWESLPEHSLQLLSSISGHYHFPEDAGKEGNPQTRKASLEYRFTLPEALLVMSVASNRYREVVLENIPFAERVTVSSLVNLYDRQEQIQTGYTWFNHIRRAVRLTNPLAAAVGELREQLTSRVFHHLSDNVQADLKRILLQEVAQVGIDLYSGRLKSSPSDMLDYRSKAHREDAERPPLAVEPLRVLLLGQTSAGKSSLVNALSDTLEAEVDTLPTTDTTQTHVLQLDESMQLHLIDTVGLDGSEERVKSASQQAFEADLIIYLARATQPARAPDEQLYRSMKAAFDARPDRRMPPLMLVVTHVDYLSPRNKWAPPYDLNSDDPKARNMALALASCIEQIGFPEDLPAVPVCLSAERGHYNIDSVAAQIMTLQDAATLTQWNRRRVERGQQSVSWNERWSQVKGLGRVLGRAALK